MLKKSYSKNAQSCKVEFLVKFEESRGAKTVAVAGDFNNWTAEPLTHHKNGDFSITITLTSGREYQFRYLFDGALWENDWHADKYVQSPYGNVENSTVIV